MMYLYLQTTSKLDAVNKELENMVKKTTRKIQTLKAQFHEHKTKWEAVSDPFAMV